MSGRRIILEKKLRRSVHFHFFSSVAREKLFNDDTLYLLVCHGSVSFGQIGLGWVSFSCWDQFIIIRLYWLSKSNQLNHNGILDSIENNHYNRSWKY
jgi:hypothetical protein